MERPTATAAMQTVRERIRNVWDVVEDEDIDRSGGSLEKLVGLISARTGQSRADVRRELRRIFAG